MQKCPGRAVVPGFLLWVRAAASGRAGVVASGAAGVGSFPLSAQSGHSVVLSFWSQKKSTQGNTAMAGKFLKRGAIIDTIKSDERINAAQKRAGKTKHPVDVVSCGCPDETAAHFTS